MASAGRAARFIITRPMAARKSRSGTSSSRSSTASAIRRTICGRCPKRTSTPAWGWNGPPRCCKACQAISRSTSCKPLCQAAGEVVGVKYEFDSPARPPAAADRRPRASQSRFAFTKGSCPISKRKTTSSGNCSAGRCWKAICSASTIRFCIELVPAVVDAMKSAYPELTETVDSVAGTIQEEETQFLEHDRTRFGPL